LVNTYLLTDEIILKVKRNGCDCLDIHKDRGQISKGQFAILMLTQVFNPERVESFRQWDDTGEGLAAFFIPGDEQFVINIQF